MLSFFFFSCGETVSGKGIWLCDAPSGVRFTSFFTEACVRSFLMAFRFSKGAVFLFSFFLAVLPLFGAALFPRTRGE